MKTLFGAWPGLGYNAVEYMFDVGMAGSVSSSGARLPGKDESGPMLELNKLTNQVAEVVESLAGQRGRLRDRMEQARRALDGHDLVTAELLDKLKQATQIDPSWRGAEPLGSRLNERQTVPGEAWPATLIATDGSQIYPDTHGIALYYLVNVGAIVLRQGSGEAPATLTEPVLALGEDDPDEEQDRAVIDTEEVNLRRALREVRMLAELAGRERAAWGGDAERLVVALADGPLLLWMPQRLTDPEQARRVDEFTAELAVLQRARAVPLGYIDRPRSANLLRVLHLAGLEPGEITKERLRKESPYRGLSDAVLFQDLEPGQRTALFATTAEVNRFYNERGQRICFCYLNVAHEPGEKAARIVRVETPEWVARRPELLQAALAAVRSDCRLVAYPYVLTRAHELALVRGQEREALEQMMRVEMMRRGLRAEESPKANTKRYTGGR